MATIFHFPSDPRDTTYTLGLSYSDVLTVLQGSILQNTRTIIDIVNYASTVEIQSNGYLETDDDSLIISSAPATTISIGLGSILTHQPYSSTIPLQPLISLFKTGDVTYGPGMAAEITNFGRLIANGQFATGIASEDGGNTIYNYGTIQITEQSGLGSAVAIRIQSDRDVTGVNAENLIVNAFDGVIEARSIAFGNWAILTSDDDDTVQNEGRITGLVDLGGGDDVFENAGTVDNTYSALSTVYLGAGNDRFSEVGTSPRAIEVQGGSGDDLFEIDDPTGWTVRELAGEGIDTLSVAVDWSLSGSEIENLILRGTGNLNGTGSAADNRITGNSGNNSLSGGGGRDTLLGDDGNDVLAGEDGNDLIYGGAYHDRIEGGAGNDVLLGGGGRDVIVGGLGRDQMRGNTLRDVFDFNSAAESGTGSDRDRIRDFAPGFDRIDLSDILPADEFAFIGTGAFTATGPEVRVTATTLAVIVQVDADGNGLAEMQIGLPGLTDASLISAADFVL